MDDVLELMKLAYNTRKVKAVFYECPHCGGKRAVPVVYGFPDDMMMQEWRGKVIELGGCIIDGKMSNRACLDCEKQWIAKKGEGNPRVEEVLLPPLPRRSYRQPPQKLTGRICGKILMSAKG